MLKPLFIHSSPGVSISNPCHILMKMFVLHGTETPFWKANLYEFIDKIDSLISVSDNSNEEKMWRI
jgi:nitrate/nitrite-specific signal transduction histidine kinase